MFRKLEAGPRSLDGGALYSNERWRSDIDGLRALAVLPVVIFHIGQSFLRGGFVGVDVFFVISGYLISGNILSRMEKGNFRVASFYEHRVRRLFPAYAVVLGVVLLLSCLMDFPPVARETSRVILSALASVTNFYFWATTDYFALPAEQISLLHTWSLSVEEQFYIAFPALIILIGRTKGRWLSAIVMATFAVSLSISAVGVLVKPAATFYLLPTRAWELLLGTLLALRVVPSFDDRRLASAAAIVGIFMIVSSAFFFTPLTPFPGLTALLPCLGAALVIHSGESHATAVSRCLSFAPVRFVGLISYSLYLWHWPILVFHRQDLLPSFGSKLTDRMVVFGLALCCGALSWLLVELPTRNQRLVPKRLLLGSTICIACVLAAGATVVLVTDGLPQRFSPAAAAMSEWLDYDPKSQFREGRCFLSATDSLSAFDAVGCLQNKLDKPTDLLLGDSHAAHLAYGFRRVFGEASVVQLTGVQCPPLIVPQPVMSRACADLIQLARKTVKEDGSIKRVWLSAAWNRSSVGKTNGWNESWLLDLKRTVAAFETSGVEVIILGPSPEYSAPLPKLLAEGLEKGDSLWAQRALAISPFELDSLMAEYARSNGLRYLSLIGEMCHERQCIEYAQPGTPIYFDSSHLLAEGALLIASKLAKHVD
ncbi:hypothetical protein C7U92_20360 [Bradyrhizobium sp. WBOS7]|uniref:Acyltransferase n=1 Tax=Bradyrhizobium betae TaxID=244734 RepID=A0AAE9SR75_9BRAD|nr:MULTISPECIES: acyltransferase family protein [Bradyrhizobium]MDD1572978.1 hypothetical protein [Bradyrhizobium sp. WBOS1]UUO33163.1 hypothetical protein DCK84_00255 [Bradyrhizobium sp. WBOS01]MDD1529415.1 hypothetical protein [Bradyrhizobium sp. WBOS2]MDD1579049.1 hypothetical protein [Bradyrhizobium sp. WBOS7]MDD1601856.1 hypothetical protein [Bradyrhizobium sp. WBOS16]